MRRIALAVLFTFLLGLAFDRDTLGQDARARQIAPGVFFWQGDRDKRQPANCGWVVFKDFVLVIDANFPWGAREILAEIKKTTGKPIRFVFNTHYHGDHAYGSSLFVDAGAAVVCSEDCAAESRSKGQAGWDKNKDASEFSLKPYRLEHPTILFGDKMVFDDGQQRVELTKLGPAHSKGDAVALLPRQKILFTGDLCVNWTHGNNVADRDADPANWIQVLGQLVRWDVQTVIPGHGSPGTRYTLFGQQQYLIDMWNQVSVAVREGKSVDETVKIVDLSRHQPFGANAERNAASVRALYQKVRP